MTTMRLKEFIKPFAQILKDNTNVLCYCVELIETERSEVNDLIVAQTMRGYCTLPQLTETMEYFFNRIDITENVPTTSLIFYVSIVLKEDFNVNTHSIFELSQNVYGREFDSISFYGVQGVKDDGSWFSKSEIPDFVTI